MIVAIATLAASAAFAQTNPPPGQENAPGQMNPSGQGNLSKSDQTFIKNAAAANEAEIKLGRLAEKKGSTEQVRKMAQTIVDDHTKVNNQLKTIAGQEGFTIPLELTPDQKAAYDKLSSLSGAEFDKAYMDRLKQDHQKAISLYQNEANNSTNPQLKSFAQQTLPALEQHKDMASHPMHKM
jgi:putative membrane protein